MTDELPFAILHGVTATELALKARLARIHPNLIYQSIDKPTILRQRTIRLSDVPNRLKNLGVSVNEKDATLIMQVAVWRNEIVHHTSTFDAADAKNKLGSLYDFLASFLRRELGQRVQDLIPRDLYRLMNGLVTDWKKVIKEAEQLAHKEGQVAADDPCPNCGVKGVVCRRNGHEAFCHLCNLDLSYGRCEGCGRTGFWSTPEVALGREFCDDCLEAAGDQAAEFLMDMERGE